MMRHEKAKMLIELAQRLAASAEGLTLDEMAQALRCGRRTAERCRDALQQLFPQIEEIPDGATKRFRISGGLAPFFQAPTASELVALKKTAEQLRASGAHARAKALEALDTKVRASMRHATLRKVEPDIEALLHAELIAVQAGPRPVEDETILKSLREGLLAMKALRFRYRGGSKRGARRKVTPYGLIFGRMNYLVAADFGDAKPKSWRLDRMEEIEVLNDPALPAPDFSLKEFANASFGYFYTDPDHVVLRVLPHGVDDDFANWRFHPNQSVEHQRDGSAIVRFLASGMLELAWHLFSWGNKIEIIAPTSLRDLMIDELQKTLKHHTHGSN